MHKAYGKFDVTLECCKYRICVSCVSYGTDLDFACAWWHAWQRKMESDRLREKALQACKLNISGTNMKINFDIKLLKHSLSLLLNTSHLVKNAYKSMLNILKLFLSSHYFFFTFSFFSVFFHCKQEKKREEKQHQYSQHSTNAIYFRVYMYVFFSFSPVSYRFSMFKRGLCSFLVAFAQNIATRAS